MRHWRGGILRTSDIHGERVRTAIRRKLILEVSGCLARAESRFLVAEQPVDCLKGERDRRLYSDPYFPELDR